VKEKDSAKEKQEENNRERDIKRTERQRSVWRDKRESPGQRTRERGMTGRDACGDK